MKQNNSKDKDNINKENKENKENINKEIEGNKENINKENEKNDTGKFTKLLGIICKVIVFGLIAIMVVIIIRIVVFHKSDVFGYKFYIIKSGSMEPEIKVLDAVITKNTDDINLGDIIAVNNSNNIIVHRVVGIDTQNGETIYTTKGDNNNTIDEGHIGKSNIEGKLVLTIPKIGKAIVFLKSHLIIFVYIIAVIIIVILIRRLI